MIFREAKYAARASTSWTFRVLRIGSPKAVIVGNTLTHVNARAGPIDTNNGPSLDEWKLELGFRLELQMMSPWSWPMRSAKV